MGRDIFHSSNWSLLAEDDSAPWFGPANFYAGEIVGPCADYPDWGGKRTFRMRGFELTIDLRPIEIDANYQGAAGFLRDFDNTDRRSYPIGRADLTIMMKPDSSARTAKPEWPKHQNPKGEPGACKIPVQNMEKPFCRDESLKVVSCGAGWFNEKWSWDR
jgi:hypothetical protein